MQKLAQRPNAGIRLIRPPTPNPPLPPKPREPPLRAPVAPCGGLERGRRRARDVGPRRVPVSIAKAPSLDEVYEISRNRLFFAKIFTVLPELEEIRRVAGSQCRNFQKFLESLNMFSPDLAETNEESRAGTEDPSYPSHSAGAIPATAAAERSRRTRTLDRILRVNLCLIWNAYYA